MWLKKLKTTRDSLELVLIREKWNGFESPCTCGGHFFLHFYRGFDLFVKELSDHHQDFFLLGSFSDPYVI